MISDAVFLCRKAAFSERKVIHMKRSYYACVYGGASERISDVYKNEVEKLGKLIADSGFSLVYGAGATGCMGAVARGVENNGGYVMGISPDFIKDFEDIFPCDNTVMVDTMAERKTLMEKHADLFIIAPGGVGTMDEFFQVVTLKYLKRIDAPIIVLNIGGFYDALLALMDSLVEQGAVGDYIYDLYDVVDDVDSPMLSSIFDRVSERV